MNYRTELIEDNGGGLHMFVFNGDDEAIAYFNGFEHSDSGSAVNDLNLADSDYESWDNPQDDPQGSYDEFCRDEHGSKLIAEKNNKGIHLYVDRMGRAGQNYVGIDNTN